MAKQRKCPAEHMRPHYQEELPVPATISRTTPALTAPAADSIGIARMLVIELNVY